MPFATHILVPTDFSEASELAIRGGALLADRLGAKLTLLHVHDPDALRAPARMAYSPERKGSIEEEVKATCRATLEKLRVRYLSDLDDVVLEMVEDESPARAICKRAEEIGADLIVIATHGRTGLKHLLIGSVAERVVRHSSVPVLSLRSRAQD